MAAGDRGKDSLVYRIKDDAPFVFAGLDDTWKDPEDGTIHRTCTIVTTEANPLMEKIHNTKQRMPVILTRENEKAWISGDISLLKARQLLLPYDQKEMHAHTISPAISDAKADPRDPKIIQTL